MWVLATLVAIGGAAAAESPEEISPGARTPPVPATLPAPYAVMAFENRSGLSGYEWVEAAVPFVLAEKLERHPRLRPAYGPLVLARGEPVAPTPEKVRAFARAHGAVWVWTGWTTRMPNWDLQLGVALWWVSPEPQGDIVRKVGEVVTSDDVSHVHRMTGAAIEALCAKAGLGMDPRSLAMAYREPTADPYAFLLFGRGLAWLTGTVGWVDRSKAEKALTRAVFIDPKLAEAQRMLGQLYLEEGHPAQARAHFSRALSVRPDYYAALAAQVDAELGAGNLDRARQLDTQMIAQRPWDLERRYHLGEVLWKLGRIAAAHVELDRVVTLRPGDVRARRILVLIHGAEGNNGGLVSELEAVLRLDPGDLPTQLDLAAAYSAVGRDEAAARIYAAVLKRHPRHAQALKFLADLHARAGRRDQAIAYYLRALYADPSDPRPYFRLAAEYLAKGDSRRAKHIYRLAQRFGAYLGATYGNLGAISYGEGNREEALWYLWRAVKIAPRDPRIRYNLALTLSALNHTDRAMAEVQAGLALDPRHVGLCYLRGVILLRRGDQTGARAAFEKVLELDPAHADARHDLALLSRTAGVAPATSGSAK